ncbi:NAD(P)/FAD-dependent oxidoreductase [Alcaligenes sp. SDU_A2]|uniref:NAD(P)/FAD-dependent oxidoreductase n=1 Tax=Alcaligenes sp. SDU_A2 TaxID=3136634 RepID=UPI00311D59EB
MSDSLHVGVIGAGIIGLATALWLQRAGCRVTLLDQQEPGEGTSSGNAGVFADYARVPFASMAQLKQLPSQLLDRQSPLSIQASYLPRLLPFGLRFIKSCGPEQFLAGCRAMAQLQRTTLHDDHILLDATHAHDLIRHKGALALCSTEQGLQQARQGHLKLRAELGTEIVMLSRREAADLEPALGDFHAGGVYYPNTRFTVSPLALSRRYAAHFILNGGRLIRTKANRLSPEPQSCLVNAGDQDLRFDHIVICSGVASANMTAALGAHIPLASERGYHLMLDDSDITLQRPIVWLDKATFLTPMQDGIRVAGTAEFAHDTAPPNPARSALMRQTAQTMLGHMPNVLSSWVGSRPSTPDSLPVIGRLPGQQRVWVAFGHGHLGLTLSSVTGRLISESLLAGRELPEIAPYSPSRFTSSTGTRTRTP